MKGYMKTRISKKYFKTDIQKGQVSFYMAYYYAQTKLSYFLAI